MSSSFRAFKEMVPGRYWSAGKEREAISFGIMPDLKTDLAVGGMADARKLGMTVCSNRS